MKNTFWTLIAAIAIFSCSNGENNIQKEPLPAVTGGSEIVESNGGVAGAKSFGGSSGPNAGDSSTAGSVPTATSAGSSGIAGSDGGLSAGASTTIETGGTETIDVGTGGEGNTIDTGSGGTIDTGSGGTADLGSGGTLDTGSGGTVDLGSGGTVDTGTGGTIDICIPTCVPDILGSGEKAVNLVVFEDAQASGCDTEGRMWVGGNADLSGYGVGMRLTECDSEDPVLVVGGDLTITGGVKGKIWVGGTFSGSAPQCGGIWDDLPPPVDFEEVIGTLTAYSNLLASYPVNGTASYQGSVLALEGDDTYLNIVEITGADLQAATAIVINAPVDSSFVVNVTGETVGFSNGTVSLPDGIDCESGSVSLDNFCNRLIWNMAEASTVSIGGFAVQGSILAPNATMIAEGSGQVNGAVIVKNFLLDTCIEMHPHYFNGCLCTEEVNSPYACCP